MPSRDMNAAWWAASGGPARWHSLIASATYDVIEDDGWVRLDVTLPTDGFFYQAPFITGATDGGVQQSEDNYNTGFFYLTVFDQTNRYPYSCAVIGIPSWRGYAEDIAPQCAQLVPANEEYELRPASETSWLSSAYYRTGFLRQGAGDGNLSQHLMTWFFAPLIGSTATINHYAPYAWNGSPPEVIAAILLQMGLDPLRLNQTAFTTANTSYNDTLGNILIGGAAGPDIAWEPQIYAVRRVGERVVDLITRIMQHTRDLYYVDESGRMSLSGFEDATDVVSGLTLDDGVLGSVQWAWTREYVFNSVSATWGSAFRQWGDSANQPDTTDFGCEQEEELHSLQATKYVHEVQNAASVAKHGAIWLRGQRRVTAYSRGKEVETAHFGLYLDPGCPVNYWEDYGYGGMMHVTNYLTSDSKDRRIVTVRQDMRALDWGIGSLVEDISVTDDGQTIAEAFCIEREYDFDRLTVTSVLMERPSNT